MDSNFKPRAGQPPRQVIPPATFGPRPGSNPLVQWGTEQVRDQAKSYAIGRVSQIAARTALGARFFGITKWLWIAQYAALGLAILLAALSILDLVQQQSKALGFFGLVLAALALGVWFIIRKIRRFIDRKIDLAFQKVQGAFGRGPLSSGPGFGPVDNQPPRRR